tara:strand:+ start:1285 stop:2253 length:969 start_codon:yes stop_codon:yes gene_type:complete
MYIITGAAGFIGFHLSHLLLKKNVQVIGIDNINDYYDVSIKKDRLQILTKFPNFTFLKLDLSNKKEISKNLKKLKKRVKVIIHLAGQAGVRYSIYNPETYIKNNIMAYIHLLEYFKNTNVKLILYASSSSVYGEKGSKKSISSKIQNKPISVYSASKLSLELISNVYNHLYGINFVGIRFFSVYGPWGRPDMFYLKLLNKINSNKIINIYNKGNHYRSFTYIDDVIENILKIIKKFNKKNIKICDVFNIGNPTSISLKKFIKIIEKKVGYKVKKAFIKKQPGDIFLTKSNINRERKIFGHKIYTNLNVGLDKLIDWYNKYYN